MTCGSCPSVFQTAPPQPSSKARMTCSPELVGGAEASQKGLGDLMPAQLVERSAISDRRDPVGVSGRRRGVREKKALDAPGRALAVRGGVDHFLAAVD